MAVLLAVAVARPGWCSTVAALHVFLGAFFYGVVYTLWLKRRTPEHRHRRPGGQLCRAGRRAAVIPASAAALAAGPGAVPVDAAALLEPGHRQPR
jgi:protoheme IX farnesyltransferase